MRIAQVSTLASPVRRELSGSIEQIVGLLTEQLVALGHDVTVFACGGSDTSGKLVETLPGPYAAPGSLGNWRLCEVINLAAAIERSDEFDVLHSHAYLNGLPLARFSRCPILHTLHVQPFDDEATLRRLYPEEPITALSTTQWSAFPDLSPLPVVHHAVDPAEFSFRAHPDPEGYVCFLGRLLPEKGPLRAIEVARELGLPLRLAGPENDYFREVLRPHIDGRTVQYVGEVTGQSRAELLGGARCLLYPIEKAEPFGLVLIESMMCGTPVAAASLGAVSELVVEGVDGCLSSPSAGLADAVIRAMALDRAAIRRRAQERFAPRRMAEQYLEVYDNVVRASRRTWRRRREPV